MELLIGWLTFAVAPAVLAARRGRTGVGWYFVSLLISPLLAFVLLLVLPNLEEDERRAMMRKCPACAELVRPEAKICRFCRHEFSAEEVATRLPQAESVALEGRGFDTDLLVRTALILLLVGVLGAGLVWLAFHRLAPPPTFP